MRMASAVLVCALPGLLLTVSARPTGAQPALTLNEFLAGPARDWDGNGVVSTRDDEWIEVLNPGPSALDLTGFLITDDDSLPRYALSGSLAPGARRVIYGREAYDWERANGFPAFGLSLNNTGDRVMLWQTAGGETLLVDSYLYAAHEAGADRAVGRLPDGGSWALFDGLNLYTGSAPPPGTGCLPSPNAPNSCGVTPVAPVSWGRVKAFYR